MLYRCFLALVLLTSLLPAQVPRTEAEAKALETRLESNPGDVNARAQLIYFYGRTRPASMSAEAVKPLRRKHILWMIQNQPDHVSLGDVAGVIEKAGSLMADPDGWTEADRAWRQAVAQSPNAAVYGNAIAFYRTSDAAFAMDLAERGLSAFPHNERIGLAKGTLLAGIVLGIRGLDPYGRATSFDDAVAKSGEAAEARKELESTSEAAVAAGGGQALNVQHFALTQQRRTKEAADAIELMEKLDKRAMELEPNNPRWKSQLASAYWGQASAKTKPADKVEVLEKSMTLADSSLKLYVMPELAKAYFDAGNNGKAKETAEALLQAAEAVKDNRQANANYSGAVHNANIVLGRVALKAQDVEEAKSRLLAAGRVSTTPVLGSFGPDWNLARDLMGKGEHDTVLKYIEECRAFWTSGASRLAAWAETIRAGGSPNFFGPPEVNRTALVGKAAPEFRLKKLGGGEVVLAELKGKVVLLDFWATWCGPCRAEMPEFEKLHKELAAKDVAILAVDADEAEDTVADFIKKEKYTLPVLLTEGTDTIRRYGISAYPTTMAVDKDGRVAEVVIGNSSDARKRLLAAIDKARSGAPAAAPDPPRTFTPPSPAVTAPPAVTADDFYGDAVRLRAANDLAGALAALDRSLALRKDWLPAMVRRADMLYQLKRYDEAVAAWTEAIRVDPKRAASYLERAKASDVVGKRQEAMADYARAIEMSPDASVPYSLRGWSRMEQGQFDEALADLNKSLELEPSNDVARGARARVFIALKQYAKAVEDCDAALRMYPRSGWASARKDEALRLMGGRPGTLAAPRLLSPEAGKVFDHFPRQTTLVWSEVPGAVEYRIEWDYQSGNSWTDHPGLMSSKEPVKTFSFVGAQPGRWRVWAVDAEGREGAKSEWREFEYTR